jgi:Septum formation
MQRRAIAVALMSLAVCFAACSGSHGETSRTTRPLDPFATAGPSSGAASASATTPSSSGQAPAPPAVAVGQCFDTDQFVPGSAIDLSSARIVDCSAPHQQEVYAIAQQPADPGAPYPGDEVLAAFADDSCLAAFTGYTGLDYQSSHYDIANARPDAAAWGRGERRVICALHDADFAELTGSAHAAPSG